VIERARRKLEKELKDLEKEYRVDLPKEILRENSEYRAALDRQQYVKARIGQVQAQLKNLSMIDLDNLPKDRVSLGSRVELYDVNADRSVTYELVISEEANFSSGLVSVTSPIGRALLGHRAGDKVTVKLPAGTREYEIVNLSTLHEKEDQ
jgi:transcription elongation factor GreA